MGIETQTILYQGTLQPGDHVRIHPMGTRIYHDGIFQKYTEDADGHLCLLCLNAETHEIEVCEKWTVRRTRFLKGYTE